MSSYRPEIVDGSRIKIAALLSEIDEDQLIDSRIDELDRSIFLAVGFDRDSETQGDAAAHYVESCIHAIERLLQLKHSAYESARWLWYLRRLPPTLFGGELKSTEGYDTSLAESLTWRIGGVAKSTSERSLSFPIDASTVRHIVRLAAGVRLMSHLHSLYRRIGKGARLRFMSGSSIPKIVESLELQEAITRYDARCNQNDGNFVSGLGLAPTGLVDLEPMSNSGSEVCVLVFKLRALVGLPVKGPDGAGGFADCVVSSTHGIQFADTSKLLLPFRGVEQGGVGFDPNIGLPLTLLLLFPYFAHLDRACVANVLQVGYAPVLKTNFHEIVKRGLPVVAEQLRAHRIDVQLDGPDGFVAALEQAEPQLWPLKSRGLIRDAKSFYMIDFASATRSLQSFLQVDRHSPFSSARGDEFERQVQHMIGESEWRPSAMFLDLRGRTLRIAGRKLTDVDALGVYGDTLLLVSCKSVVFDAKYDKGEFATVRNREALVNQAFQSCQKTLSILLQQPCGDNFDFSVFSKMICAVCTPFPVYTSSPHSNFQVDSGLFGISSFEELRVWLNSKRTGQSTHLL